MSALRCVRDMLNLLNAGITNDRDMCSNAGIFLLQFVDEDDLDGQEIVTAVALCLKQALMTIRIFFPKTLPKDCPI